jgi:SAM-dependent methyltransferase
MDCRICGHRGEHTSFRAREMMYGSRETYDYFQCSQCECLQIARIPEDMASHYPDNYYSKSESLDEDNTSRRPGLTNALSAAWRLKVFSFGFDRRGQTYAWLRRSGVNKSSRILDIGCGQGHLLNELAADGFEQLTGLDPFVSQDIVYNNGVHIHKAQLDGLNGQFDLVMMHHSMEHMADQHNVLALASKLLKPTGCLLVRIPVLGYTWRVYGVDWGQLDAPRHFYLHSFRSFEQLVGQSSLRIDASYCDSTSLQFWLSEQYVRDIPLHAPNSLGVDPQKCPFSSDQLKAWHRRAVGLNARRDGDSACFFLRHKAA